MPDFITENSELVVAVVSVILTALISSAGWIYRFKKTEKKEYWEREREFADQLIDHISSKEYETMKVIEKVFHSRK